MRPNATRGKIVKSGAGAILYNANGQYLLQLRDDRPAVSMRNCWGLFGGVVEHGERSAQAVLRELNEELSFVPAAAPTRFLKVEYGLQFAGHGVHRKTFYPVEITARDIAAMRLREGQEMRLFSLAAILALPNVLPWDLFGLMMFDRQGWLKDRLRK